MAQRALRRLMPALTVILAVAALSLSACGRDKRDPDENGNVGGTETVTVQPTPTTTPIVEPTTAPPTTPPPATTTQPAQVPSLVATEVKVSNSLGRSTTCLLIVKIHNNSNFQATGVKVQTDVALQRYDQFKLSGLPMTGPTSIGASGDASYSNYIGTVVNTTDALKITIHILVGGTAIRTESVPDFRFCTY